MNWNKLFESFYKFLLRDFLAKIVPGGVVIWAFCHDTPWFLDRADAIADVPLVVWLFLAGVAWVTGFAIQVIPELLFWWRPYMNTELAQEQVDQRIEVLQKFSEEGRRDFERLTAIKKISQNAGTALLLLAIAAAGRYCQTIWLMCLLCGFLAVIGLFHLSRYCEKLKGVYREREVPKRRTRAPAPSTGARRKVAKKKMAKKKTAKKKRR